MKKVGRILSLVLVVFMAAAMFAGCGSGTSKGGEETKAQTSEKAEGTGVQETAAEKVKLNYWAWDEEKGYLDPAIKAFNESHSNIEVVVNYYHKETDTAKQDPLVIAFAGGEDIDLFGTANNMYLASYYGKKQCRDILDLIKKDNFDVSGYGPLFEAQKIDGKSLGLMYRKSFWALYYNKDIFDKAGVAYPKDSMKWSEFRELAKKLTSGNGNEKIYGTFNDTWGVSTFGQASQVGKTLGVPDNEEALKNAMAFWRGLWVEDKSLKSWADIKSQGTWTVPEFETGKVAMVVHGDWMAGMIADDKKAGKTTVNFDVVLPPVNEGVEPGTSWSMPTTLCIGAKSANVDAAWEFAKWYCGVEGAKILASLKFYPAYTTPEVVDIYVKGIGAEPANMKNVLNTIKPMPEYGLDVKMPGILKSFEEENEMVQLGVKTPEQAIDDYKKKVAALK